MSIFEDVRIKEADQIESASRALATKGRELVLAKRVLAIRGAPGWQELVDAVEKLRFDVLGQMAQCMASNDYLRLIQGRAQALNDVLAIMTRAENRVEILEDQIQELQTLVSPGRQRS